MSTVYDKKLVMLCIVAGKLDISNALFLTLIAMTPISLAGDSHSCLF